MGKYPKINYIGNKTKLADWIISNLPITEGTVLDLFSGGASVSYQLKKCGFSVIANDSLYSNYILSKAIVENKADVLDRSVFDLEIREADVQNKYSEISSYLTDVLYYKHEVEELARLLLISDRLKDYQKSLFLALIRRAMIRKLPYSRMNVPWNQIQKLRDEDYSYQKYGRKRAYHNKSFQELMLADLQNYNDSVFDNGRNNRSYHKDAYELVRELKERVDVIYMDPPYPKTMNKYSDFYGIYDKIFQKEIPYTDLSKEETFCERFVDLIEMCAKKASYIAISLNNKTSPSIEELGRLIQGFGEIRIAQKEHQYKVTNKENKNTTVEQLLILKTM